MVTQPTYHTAISLASGHALELYALRDDGAVFILLRRGTQAADGVVLRDPRWIQAPAVPGTVAALEQEG